MYQKNRLLDLQNIHCPAPDKVIIWHAPECCVIQSYFLPESPGKKSHMKNISRASYIPVDSLFILEHFWLKRSKSSLLLINEFPVMKITKLGCYYQARGHIQNAPMSKQFQSIYMFLCCLIFYLSGWLEALFSFHPVKHQYRNIAWTSII